MENQTVTVKRSMFRNELTASNYFETAKPGYKLKVSTWKGARCITSNFQAVEVKEGSESFMLVGDYSKIILHPELKRATEKAIAQAQTAALLKVDEIMKEFNAHYKINS